MAATGEECYYQKPIREYYDFSYDKMFDAHIEHDCARFEKNVVPARQCGTVCSEFKPSVGIARPDQSRADEGDVQAEKSARIRKYVQQQLYGVCDRLRDTAQAMEQQNAMREQRLRDVDRWLGHAETQPDALVREVEVAEQALSTTLAGQDQAYHQQRPEKERHRDSRELHQFQFTQQQWAVRVKYARVRVEHARARVAARSRLETEQERLYDQLKEATERLPLLKQLRAEVAHCVKSWLVDTDKQLTDAEIDVTQRFLQDVARYAGDDVSIASLRKKVDELSQRDSPM